jgi:hypothetical protein
LVELYSFFLEKINFKSRLSNTVQAGRQRAATSRARAPRVAGRPSTVVPARLPDDLSA